MENQTNGTPIALPTIKVMWDPTTQSVGLEFNVQDFKTWNFVVAALEMAKREAERKWQEARIVEMQMAQRQAQQDAVMAKKIYKGM